MGWSNPQQLEQGYINAIYNNSRNNLQYQIVGRQIVDDFPIKASGFDYVESTYLQCIRNQGPCHIYDLVNYYKILSDFDICTKVNNNEIDEVWLWGGPYFGFYESNMTGTGSYWTNGSVVDSNCNRPIHIMGFNYERDLTAMVHNFGHRIEGTMSQVFLGGVGNWDGYMPDGNQAGTVFNQFTKTGFQSSPTGCGLTHGALNNAEPIGDDWYYDYDNLVNKDTLCEDFINYPYLTYNLTPVNCSYWGCNEFGFHEYWMKKLPHVSGYTSGISNNWWDYITGKESVLGKLASKGEEKIESAGLNCTPWVANCANNMNYYERDCATQDLFNRTWGDGYARWQIEACESGWNPGGGGFDSSYCGASCSSINDCLAGGDGFTCSNFGVCEHPQCPPPPAPTEFYFNGHVEDNQGAWWTAVKSSCGVPDFVQHDFSLTCTQGCQTQDLLWCPQNPSSHFDLMANSGPVSITLSNLPANYGCDGWEYTNYTTGAVIASGTGCTANFNMPSEDWTRHLKFKIKPPTKTYTAQAMAHCSNGLIPTQNTTLHVGVGTTASLPTTWSTHGPASGLHEIQVPTYNVNDEVYMYLQVSGQNTFLKPTWTRPDDDPFIDFYFNTAFNPDRWTAHWGRDLMASSPYVQFEPPAEWCQACHTISQVSPANGSTIGPNNATLTWQDCATAAAYRLQISGPGVNVTTAPRITNYQHIGGYAHQAGKTYQWRVRTCNDTNCSSMNPWSGWWTYKWQP